MTLNIGTGKTEKVRCMGSFYRAGRVGFVWGGQAAVQFDLVTPQQGVSVRHVDSDCGAPNIKTQFLITTESLRLPDLKERLSSSHLDCWTRQTLVNAHAQLTKFIHKNGSTDPRYE